MHTLQQFKVAQYVQVFRDAKVLPLFFSTNLVDPNRVVKVFENDPQANIKVFYYQYLKLCFESETADYQQYIQKIEQLINNQAFSILFFHDNDPAIFSDTLFKNHIVQFFGILSQGLLSIEQAINLYPIMDVVFVHFFRSLLIFIGQSQSLDSLIPRCTLFNALNDFFGVKIFEHELCIKFVDTDIFVYEQHHDKVYMAFINPDYPPTEVTYEDGSYGANISYFEAPVEVINPNGQYQNGQIQREAEQIQREIDQWEAEKAKEERSVQYKLQLQQIEDEKRAQKAKRERDQQEKAQEEKEQKNKAEKERIRKMQQEKQQTRAGGKVQEQKALRDRAENGLVWKAKEETQRKVQEVGGTVELVKNTLRAPAKVNQSYIDGDFVDYTHPTRLGLDLIQREMKKSTLLEDKAQAAVSVPYFQMQASPSIQMQAAKSISPDSKGKLQGTSYVQYSFNSMQFGTYNQPSEQKYVPPGKVGMTPSRDQYIKPYEVSTKNHPWGLNVSREFTNSFVQKAMREPYRSRVNEARERARLNRKSLAPYMI